MKNTEPSLHGTPEQQMLYLHYDQRRKAALLVNGHIELITAQWADMVRARVFG